MLKSYVILKASGEIEEDSVFELSFEMRNVCFVLMTKFIKMCMNVAHQCALSPF